MEINLVALGLGNGRLAIGTFRSGELDYIARVDVSAREDWAGHVASAWGQIAAAAHPSVAAASVNPPLDAELDALVQKTCGVKIQWIGKDIELPIEVRTQTPSETGLDRVLCIAAAFEQLGKSCVVVDAGTAITVNCCDDQGDFLGGAIFPGVSMMLDALHEKTARLPRVEFEVPTSSEAIADSTRSSICHGIFYGVRGMVRELVENYATELGAWPEVIATGGDAEKLFNGWDAIHAISPDLLLYGIALAYVNHNLKRDNER
jgi:type III pantothenate kinase